MEKPLSNQKVAQMYLVVLYLDDSDESKQVKDLVEQTGISLIISNTVGSSLFRRPALLWGIGYHHGLESIKTWLDSVIFER